MRRSLPQTCGLPADATPEQILNAAKAAEKKRDELDAQLEKAAERFKREFPGLCD